MPVLILFRRSPSPNRFRDLILACVRSRAGDEAILCSGFFQEAFNGAPYRASQEGGFASTLSATHTKLLTLGVHNRSWLRSYQAFAAALRAAGVVLTARLAQSFHWHAKVFVYSRAGEPLLGIVGSSNLTRNAFSDSAPHNYEADVVLWDENTFPFDPLSLDDTLFAATDPHDFLLAPYDIPMNGGLSLRDRLLVITDEVLAVPHSNI